MRYEPIDCGPIAAPDAVDRALGTARNSRALPRHVAGAVTRALIAQDLRSRAAAVWRWRRRFGARLSRARHN